MPHRYLTRAELLALRGEAELLRLAGPGGRPAINKAIEQAEAEATSYLLGRYRSALPSAPSGTPSVLKAKVAVLAHRKLTAGGQPSPALEAEARQEALFDKKLAQEEAWIRQGIKARRTRNEGRVRALKKLREDRGLTQEELAKKARISTGCRHHAKMPIPKRLSREETTAVSAPVNFPCS